jgi:hypothetical protein
MEKLNQLQKESSQQLLMIFPATPYRNIFHVLVLFCFLLNGCTSKTNSPPPNNTPINYELHFETIDQNEGPTTSQGYESEKPSVILIASETEVNLLSNLVSQNGMTTLKTINFNDYFCVTVFQGKKTTNGYKITVERVVRQGNTISVIANMFEPGSDTKKGDVNTSPYHLIKISKDHDLKGSFTFKLLIVNNEVFKLEKEIP